MGPALARFVSLHELNTQVFTRWSEGSWDTPGVAHDNPPAEAFHASIVLGFADEAARTAFFEEAALKSLSDATAEYCSAVHAYPVEETHIFVKDGRVTIPQVAPVPKPTLDPACRTLPSAPERASQEESLTPFPPARLIPLSGHGAEDVVADAKGRLLCGLADGRIIRLELASGQEETLGRTGGRPLGLEVLEDGRVLICDAQRGLLRLDPATAEIETLVHSVEGIPLRFCSNVTASKDGTYWFTESTNRFDFEHYIGAMLEHRPSGRLFRRDPDGRVEIVLEGLHFANGVTLTEYEEALIFAETDGYRLSKLWLQGTRQGELEVIADNLPGFADNLSSVKNGRFWAAMPNARQKSLDNLSKVPGPVRKLAWKRLQLPLTQTSGTTWVMAFDTNGRVLADLQTSRTDFFGATGVVESGGKVFLSSVDGGALLEIRAS
ncbi:SMP-30/gluconolactonase/LRE family protein [Parafrankia sp. BMG5.11]|nr:SMP-30/gluconolactonase/LRE family protein [Parafrankia sp. BMG5.11]